MKALNVIVVEDSEDDLILIEHYLKKAGYDLCSTQVETAAGLKEALADDQWQLVLCDHNMPTYSAPEALETLKESGRNLPFIVVSGTIDERIAAAIIENGAAGYVDKRDFSNLGPAVAGVLGS